MGSIATTARDLLEDGRSRLVGPEAWLKDRLTPSLVRGKLMLLAGLVEGPTIIYVHIDEGVL